MQGLGLDPFADEVGGRVVEVEDDRALVQLADEQVRAVLTGDLCSDDRSKTRHMIRLGRR